MALKSDEMEEIKKAVHDAAHEAAGGISQKLTIATVHATLKAIGLDAEKPFELQEDFAHLRKARKDSHDTKKSTKDAAIRWTVNGVFIIVISWLAANSPWGGGGLSGN